MEKEPPRLRVVLSEPGQLCPPIWSCTSRGLPCPRCCHRGGGLLPHLFTLTGDANLEDVPKVFLRAITGLRFAGGTFSVALSVTRLESTVKSDCVTKNVPWRYQARCPFRLRGFGVRTFLPSSVESRPR